MRTGKESNRTFVIDEDQTRKGDELLQAGIGMFGGDLARNPAAGQTLREFMGMEDDFELFTNRDPSDPFYERDQSFLKDAPLEIEIGYGRGQFILERASRFPETHFIGFEVHRQLCTEQVRRIEESGLNNILVCFQDARIAMQQLFPKQSLRRISIFFPDPWWKRRHVKKRVFTPLFLDILSQYLIPHEGILHIKTDVAPYGEVIREMFEQNPRFVPETDTAELFRGDLPTEREAFCLDKGLPFDEFCFRVDPDAG